MFVLGNSYHGNTLYAVTSFRHFSQGNPAITSCIVHHNCSIPSDTDVYCHAGGCGYNHSKCSLHRTITFHLCCEISLQKSEKLLFLEAIPAKNTSCTGTVEYHDKPTVGNHDCSSHLRTTIDTSTSDYTLAYICGNVTC